MQRLWSLQLTSEIIVFGYINLKSLKNLKNKGVIQKVIFIHEYNIIPEKEFLGCPEFNITNMLINLSYVGLGHGKACFSQFCWEGY